jgi:hypothetical protein
MYLIGSSSLTAAGPESSLERRAAAASDRPLPGAGAALFALPSLLSCGATRPASDLAGFFPCNLQGLHARALAAFVAASTGIERPLRVVAATIIRE